MTKITRRRTRSTRRWRKSGHVAGHKTIALYEAGGRLLSRYDFDDIKMERLAKEAGCSVGTLYDHFDSKETFLRRLSAATFHTLREDAKLVLDNGRWRHESIEHIIHQIVRHIVLRMTTRRAAGVIRAAVKLGATDTITREFFEDYRKNVTENAVVLLAPRLGRNAATRVRIAMQIIFAAVTDAILHKKPGPLQAGNARMTDALSSMICGYLGVADADWAGDEADGKDEQIEEFESETEPEVPDGHMPLYDSDLRVYRGVVPSRSHVKKRTSQSQKSRLHGTDGISKNSTEQSQAVAGQRAPDIIKLPNALKRPLEPEHRTPSRKRRHTVI